MSHPVKDPVSWLYPPIEPYRTERLKVSDVHELYFEESGNPKGKPVVFLHGGPGGGTDPKQRRFFDPDKYRIVLFDQRGCGKSTPYASLEENTTWDLVSDIEKLREHLGIERWQVFGGSWGSTLALAYAEKHPDRVTELVLRGIFLLRKKEIDWFYQEGASIIFPDAWEPYLAHIPEAERGDLVAAYHKRLTSDDPAVRLAAAKIWSVWEGATSSCLPGRLVRRALRGGRVRARLRAHRGALLRERAASSRWTASCSRRGKIRHIPGVIVQGRYDVVCPIDSAWALHRAWPEADLRRLARRRPQRLGAAEHPRPRRRDGQVRLRDLRAFLDALRKENDLAVVEAEADPRLEIPEIHRRVIEEGGPALLFTRPKGSPFPVVTNLFGTTKRDRARVRERARPSSSRRLRAPRRSSSPRPPRSSGGSARSSRGALRRRHPPRRAACP